MKILCAIFVVIVTGSSCEFQVVVPTYGWPTPGRSTHLELLQDALCQQVGVQAHWFLRSRNQLEPVYLRCCLEKCSKVLQTWLNDGLVDVFKNV